MVAALWSIEPKQLRDEFGVPRHAIKLLYPLKNLNPTNKLAIRSHYFRDLTMQS